MRSRSAGAKRRDTIALALSVIFLGCGIALRLVGLDWDASNLFHPDERNIVVAASALFRDGSWSPDFFAYNNLSLYAPRFIAEFVSLFPGMPAGGDLVLLSRVCRWMSGCASCAAIFVLADTGRHLGGAAGCMIAAAFASFDAGLIQAAHFGTTESALVLCVTLLAWLAVLLVRGEILLSGFALAGGAALGIGLALKTTAASFAAVPAIAGLCAWRSYSFRRLLVWALMGGGLAALLFVALSPFSFIDFDQFRDTMRFENGVVTGETQVFWTLQFFGTPKGLFQLSQMILLSGPALMGLGFAGAAAVIFGAISGDSAARPLIPVTAFALIYAAIVFTWQAKFVRYLLPLTPAIILSATWISLSIVNAPEPGVRKWGRALVAFAMLATAIWGTAFSSIYFKKDSRLGAVDWLAAKTKVGDVIAIEEYETLSPLPQQRKVVVLPLLAPDTPGSEAALARLLAGADWIVVGSKRHSATLPRLPAHQTACAYYLALARGDIGFQPAALFERSPGFSALALPTRFGEETLSVFDHPRVRIYANAVHLSEGNIIERLLGEDLQSCSSLRIGSDLLDLTPAPQDR